MEKNVKFKCLNNSEHGYLRQSKYTLRSYLCDKCEGFACWDVKQLNLSNSEENLPDSGSTFSSNILRKMNEEFQRRLKYNISDPLPFGFRLVDNNNPQDAFDQALTLESFDIVSGNKVPKNGVHDYTRGIVESICEELLKKHYLPIFWD